MSDQNEVLSALRRIAKTWRITTTPLPKSAVKVVVPVVFLPLLPMRRGVD